MTKQDKEKYGNIGIGVFIILLFSYGGWLSNVKADRTELVPIKAELKEQCEKIEKTEDILIDVRLEVKEIHTLLKEKLK